MSLSILTVAKLLPFVAVTMYELVGSDYTGRFKTKFGNHFDFNRQYVSHSVDDTLSTNLNSLDDDRADDIADEVVTGLSIKQDRVTDDVNDFAIFVADWTRIQTSIFATTISAIAVIGVQAIATQTTQTSNFTVPLPFGPLQAQTVDVLIVLLIVIIVPLILLSHIVDQRFRSWSPHKYDRPSLIESFGILTKRLHPNKRKQQNISPRLWVIGINMAAILFVVIADLL